MAYRNLSERPGMAHAQGMVDGVESFRAMLDAAKRNGNKERISDIVFHAAEAFIKLEGHTRPGAAGFKLLMLVAESIEFYARSADYEQSLDTELQKARENQQRLVNIHCKLMAEEANKDSGFQSFLARATEVPRE